MAEKGYANDSREYQAYLSKLQEGPQLVLRRPCSRELHDIDQLLEEGFLFASKDYERAARGGSSSENCAK